MMHGCTEPSSTLHPYAFAIAAHNRTDPMGANANATMTKNTSEYHSHGNFLCGLLFITAIPNHRLRVNSLRRVFNEFAEQSRVARPSPKVRRTQPAAIYAFAENAPGGPLAFFQTLFRQPRCDSDRRRAGARATHLHTRDCHRVPLRCGKVTKDNRQNPIHLLAWQNSHQHRNQGATRGAISPDLCNNPNTNS